MTKIFFIIIRLRVIFDLLKMSTMLTCPKCRQISKSASIYIYIYIKDQGSIPLHIEALVADIRFLLSSFCNAFISYVCRSANKAADWIARSARRDSASCIWVSHLSSFVLPLLRFCQFCEWIWAVQKLIGLGPPDFEYVSYGIIQF